MSKKEWNYPPKLIPNGDFDIEYITPAPFVPRVICNDRHWNSLRLREKILQGEWITEKKEKKYMFFKKLWRSIEGLETSVEKHNKKISGDGVHNSSNPGLNSRVWDLENKTEPEYIDCHTCGCVVRKEIAFRGNDRIEREGLPEGTISFSNVPPEYTEVVYETWYCKLHKRGKKEYGSK